MPPKGKSRKDKSSSPLVAASSRGSSAACEGFRVWIESSMRRVYPASSPPPQERPLSVKLFLAKGEYQSFQIVLRSEGGQELRDFSIDVGALAGETEIAAEHYADIRAALKRRGELIGANDLFIAAHARCLGLTLITNNTQEFSRAEGLALENWAV